MRFRWLEPFMLLEGDNGGGGGGAGSDDHETENEGLRKRLAQHNNDAMSLAAELWSNNYTWRSQNRDLKREIQQLKDAAPKEGSVVLTADDAKAWEAYKALGKPDDVRTAIQRKEELERLEETRGKQSLVQKAAGAVGFDPEVLTDLAASKGLTIEVEESETDGEKKVAAYVTKDGQKVNLQEYAEKNLARYLPALKASNGNGSGNGNGTGSGGMSWPAQTGSGRGTGETRDPALFVTSQYSNPYAKQTQERK